MMALLPLLDAGTGAVARAAWCSDDVGAPGPARDFPSVENRYFQLFAPARADERGYTLVEMVVVVAIAAMLLAGVVPLFSSHPAEIATSIGMVQTMIDEASVLAFANGADAAVGRGSTIQFTTDQQTGETLGRVYWGRPYSVSNNADITLQPEENISVVRTMVRLRVQVLGNLVDPPFAIFMSPTGHASTAQGDYVMTTHSLSENPCVGNFSIEFSLGTDLRRRNVGCDYAKMLPTTND
jgi:prepilin-type N-terminal cleavage/methylation domain-containing protein